MNERNKLRVAMPGNDFVQAVCNHGDFGHETDDIQVIETLMSWVFVTGKYAYKIKKPVRFAFADFSTLARRRHFCEEELRINRRFAPQLYVDMVPIGGTPTRPVFGHEPAFEYAVRLVQFAPSARADMQLRHGRLSHSDIESLASLICKFQRGAARAPVVRGYGSAPYIERLALSNIGQLKPFYGHDLRWRQLHDWTHSQLTKLHDLFAQRCRSGAIREGHGDLHLQNLVRTGRQIVPFDALEFNHALRCIDTMDEVAFAAMDLMAHERADLGYVLINAYCEHNGDYPGIRVLRFYLVYRALVRAKVRSLCRDNGPPDSPCAEVYLALADALSQPQRPLLVLAHGLSGSGKSTILGNLIGPLQAIRMRSDVERKRLFALPADANSASPVGRGIYSTEATARTYAAMASDVQEILQSGFSVLVDAAFLRRAQRDQFRSLGAQCGADTAILRCEASIAELRRRVVHRQGTPDQASEATQAVLEQQLREHDALTTDEEAIAVTVNTEHDVSTKKLAQALSVRNDDRRYFSRL